MKIGAHVSIAGGVYNAPANAAALGGEVFQLFLRSPRGGPAPELTDHDIQKFMAAAKDNNQAAWVVHTPYYINYASGNTRIREGSIRVVREELERASKIGAEYLMTHLGSGKDVTAEAGEKMVIDGLTEMLEGYHGSTVFCIEIAAGAGQILGRSFPEIGGYIKAVEKNLPAMKNKIGVCFDTCHAFASGYDLRDAAAVKKTMAEFDKFIGSEKLKCIHANDSKFDLGERKDRHEHIGQGKIGLAGFKAMVAHPVLQKVNWYLETEPGGVQNDITLLKKLRDHD